jgi:hypothetical protein
VIYHNGGGNIPLPKFDPKLDTAENFLPELEVYMRSDWVLMLSPIFNHDAKQLLWWRQTRMVVKSWRDFKNHFRGFFASGSEMHFPGIIIDASTSNIEVISNVCFQNALNVSTP